MNNQLRDIQLPDIIIDTFKRDAHINFIVQNTKDESSYEQVITEYLRMSGIYWCLTTLKLLETDSLSEDDIMDFIFKCINDDGGISPCINHDSHLLYTLSAIQIACTFDRQHELPVDKIVEYVKRLQQPDGSFTGDKWGEVDTRFSFCAVLCLSLLKRLDAVDMEMAVQFVMSCYNYDGAFGSKPNSESHAGLIYCCVGFLYVTGNLYRIDADRLGHWLCERQLPSGGLNGRPEKLPDVCYSWWVVSSLHMIGRAHWIDSKALKSFILACQDSEAGGISDRPGDMSDPFHTLFGIAALSLMREEGIKEVNPCYCMPQDVIDRILPA